MKNTTKTRRFCGRQVTTEEMTLVCEVLISCCLYDTFNGSVEFMKECFARLPKRAWKVDVCADSGFFNGALLDFIESRQGQYTIKVKMKGLVSLLEQQNWHKVPKMDCFEKTEFEYKCGGWKKKRRFASIRKIREYTEETDNQCLFDSRKIKYGYFCYVTNMDL